MVETGSRTSRDDIIRDDAAPIRVGIIGMGRMGTFHATQASTLASAKVTALVDTDVTRINDDLAPAALRTTNYTLLFDLVDAVVIATPTPAHYQIAHEFLSRGIHVLVEKPVTPTLAQAKKLFQLAQQHQCALHIGHVERYNHAFLTAQKILSGESPELFRAVRSGPFNARVAHDSVLLDLMIHDIDLVTKLTKSEVVNTHALGTQRHSQLIDSATASLSFANGALATITAHRTASCGTRQLIVDTATQQLCIDFGTQTVTQRRGNDVIAHEPPVGHNPLREQLSAFVQAVATGTQLHDATHDLSVLQHTLSLEKQATAHQHTTVRTHEAARRA